MGSRFLWRLSDGNNGLFFLTLFHFLRMTSPLGWRCVGWTIKVSRVICVWTKCPGHTLSRLFPLHGESSASVLVWLACLDPIFRMKRRVRSKEKEFLSRIPGSHHRRRIWASIIVKTCSWCEGSDFRELPYRGGRMCVILTAAVCPKQDWEASKETPFRRGVLSERAMEWGFIT